MLYKTAQVPCTITTIGLAVIGMVNVNQVDFKSILDKFIIKKKKEEERSGMKFLN